MSEQQTRVFNAMAMTPSGITQVDFLPPHVIDRGEPIPRVSARINELRTKFGCSIPITRERRHGHAVYKLDGVEPPPLQAPTASPQCAIFDYEESFA